MAPTIPTIEPSRFAAGQTVQWTKVVADYPSTDYNLVYSFRGPKKFADVTATNNSDGSYSVTLPAAGTTGTINLDSGHYEWVANAVTGTGTSIQRYPVASGVMIVAPSLLGGVEGISHSARTLAIIEAKIEGRLTQDQQGYSINGRSIQKIPIKELYSLRAMYKAAVWRENNPGKSGPTRKVTFVPA